MTDPNSRKKDFSFEDLAPIFEVHRPSRRLCLHVPVDAFYFGYVLGCRFSFEQALSSLDPSRTCFPLLALKTGTNVRMRDGRLGVYQGLSRRLSALEPDPLAAISKAAKPCLVQLPGQSARLCIPRSGLSWLSDSPFMNPESSIASADILPSSKPRELRPKPYFRRKLNALAKERNQPQPWEP